MFLAAAISAAGQELSALRIFPNLAGNVDRPLRYHPEGADFVIGNGGEFFNRSLYGGDTAFRVDGGDKPEFVLYLPGRGGNLRLAFRSPAGARWLHQAAHIVTRYRPGELLYEVRDPVLGSRAVLWVEALAYDRTEGLIVRATAEGIGPGFELAWAYGGVSGERGQRDGDIGTERVPISQYFQLLPEFCRDNSFQIAKSRFTVKAKAATIAGLAPAGATLAVGRRPAMEQSPLPAGRGRPRRRPSSRSIVGRAPLVSGQPLLFSLQRLAVDAEAAAGSQHIPGGQRGAPGRRPPAGQSFTLAPEYAAADLPRHFAETEAHFAALRARVAVDTPIRSSTPRWAP